MTRPVYETVEDRANEGAVAALLEIAWGCRLLPMKKLFTADYAAVDDRLRIRAFVEIKCRRIGINDYAEVYLSGEKVRTLCAMDAAYRKPAIIVWRYRDGEIIYGRACHLVVSDVRLHGRTDRDDAADVEPLMYFPINQDAMKKLTERKNQ